MDLVPVEQICPEPGGPVLSGPGAGSLLGGLGVVSFLVGLLNLSITDLATEPSEARSPPVPARQGGAPCCLSQLWAARLLSVSRFLSSWDTSHWPRGPSWVPKTSFDQLHLRRPWFAYGHILRSQADMNLGDPVQPCRGVKVKLSTCLCAHLSTPVLEGIAILFPCLLIVDSSLAL